MNLQAIKQATDNGLVVCWKTMDYRVEKDDQGQYMVVRTDNGNSVGLTDESGNIVESPADFYLMPPSD